MPESDLSASSTSVNPDFAGLVRFLVEPFLESPDSLKVDCEVLPQRSRVWVRLAFESGDKGRVFGRGGRNIQAIRETLQAAAQLINYTVHLDIYGSQEGGREERSKDGRSRRPRSRSNPRSRRQDS